MSNPPKGTPHNDPRLPQAQRVCCELPVLSALQDASTEIFMLPQSITLSASLILGTGKRLYPQSNKKTKAAEETHIPLGFDLHT